MEKNPIFWKHSPYFWKEQDSSNPEGVGRLAVVKPRGVLHVAVYSENTIGRVTKSIPSTSLNEFPQTFIFADVHISSEHFSTVFVN